MTTKLAKESRDEYIHRMVAAAPPLMPLQIEHLRALLPPAGPDPAEVRAAEAVRDSHRRAVNKGRSRRAQSKQDRQLDTLAGLLSEAIADARRGVTVEEDPLVVDALRIQAEWARLGHPTSFDEAYADARAIAAKRMYDKKRSAEGRP